MSPSLTLLTVFFSHSADEGLRGQNVLIKLQTAALPRSQAVTCALQCLFYLVGMLVTLRPFFEHFPLIPLIAVFLHLFSIE